MARPGLKAHPKFRRLVHLVGQPVPHVLGYLECLWSVCYETGNPVIGDVTDIELAAEWPNERGVLFKAMLECGGEGRAGFIEPVPNHPGRFQVHDLMDHAPSYVTQRRNKEVERSRPKVCEHCGADFRSSDERARFCSDACRQAAYRKRHHGDSSQSVTERDSGERNALRTVTDRNDTPAPAPAPPIQEIQPPCAGAREGTDLPASFGDIVEDSFRANGAAAELIDDEPTEPGVTIIRPAVKRQPGPDMSGPDGLDDARSAAFAAFNEWAKHKRPLGIGRELLPMNREHEKIFALVQSLATRQELVSDDQGKKHRQHEFIPTVVRWLVAEKGERFVSDAYAVKVVRSRLDEWVQSGMPPKGAALSAGGQRVRPQRRSAVLVREDN